MKLFCIVIQLIMRLMTRRTMLCMIGTAMLFILTTNIILVRLTESLGGGLPHAREGGGGKSEEGLSQRIASLRQRLSSNVTAVPMSTPVPTTAKLAAKPTTEPKNVNLATPRKRSAVYTDADVALPVKENPGGTEEEALVVRRKLSKLNWPLKEGYRDVHWTQGSRPQVPFELITLQHELSPSSSWITQTSCSSMMDFYCLSKALDGLRWKGNKFCDGIYSHSWVDILREEENTHAMCSGGRSKITCHNFKVPSHETETAACEGSHVLVDFDKMLDGDFPWLQFTKGAFSAQCHVPDTAKEHWQFMHSLADWMDLGFHSTKDPLNCDVWINTTTVFVTRSGDYSPFAITHDMINTLIPMMVYGVDAKDVQVVLMDRMTVGFFAPVWQLVFSPTKQVLWFPDLREMYRGKKVCYQRAIINIPARLSFFYNFHTECMEPSTPWSSGLARLLRDLVLNSLGALYTTSPPEKIVVTIINRRNYKTGHPIGRRIQNIEALAHAISQVGDDVNVNVVDYASYDFDQQLNISRATDVLVGMHGAGLIHIMYLPTHAGVFEFFCPEKPPSNYRYQYLSALMGVKYQSYDIQSSVHEVPLGTVMPMIGKLVEEVRRRKETAKIQYKV